MLCKITFLANNNSSFCWVGFARTCEVRLTKLLVLFPNKSFKSTWPTKKGLVVGDRFSHLPSRNTHKPQPQLQTLGFSFETRMSCLTDDDNSLMCYSKTVMCFRLTRFGFHCLFLGSPFPCSCFYNGFSSYPIFHTEVTKK